MNKTLESIKFLAANSIVTVDNDVFEEIAVVLHGLNVAYRIVEFPEEGKKNIVLMKGSY